VRRVPLGRRRRREQGGVVTYVVTVFMIVALAIYLGVAYFQDHGDEDEEPADGRSPVADEAR